MARWFALRIDLLSAALLAVVAFVSIPLASSEMPSLHAPLNNNINYVISFVVRSQCWVGGACIDLHHITGRYSSILCPAKCRGGKYSK